MYKKRVILNIHFDNGVKAVNAFISIFFYISTNLIPIIIILKKKIVFNFSIISENVKMKRVRKILQICFSLIYWIFFVITALVIFPLYLIIFFISFPIDKKRRVVHFFTRLWALFYLYINPWIKLETEGIHTIKKNKTYIIICNHQSMLDIFVLYVLPMHFRWISKLEIFKIPIVGLIMRLNKYIPLERGNRDSIEQMYSLAEESLNNDISILIFPEGTRSEDGRIKKFKEGAFKLSMETKKNILMLILDNAYAVLPKNSIFFERRTKVKIKVIGEIDYIKREDFDEAINRVEEIYKKELENIRDKK